MKLRKPGSHVSYYFYKPQMHGPDHIHNRPRPDRYDLEYVVNSPHDAPDFEKPRPRKHVSNDYMSYIYLTYPIDILGREGLKNLVDKGLMTEKRILTGKGHEFLEAWLQNDSCDQRDRFIRQ